MKNNLQKLGFIFVVFVALLLCVATVGAGAADNQINEQRTYELADGITLPEDNSVRMVMPDNSIGRKEVESVFSGGNSPLNIDFSLLPSSFDLRDYNMVTPVRKQGDYSTCWIFATIGAIESAILKEGLVSPEDADTFDLSELQVVYFFGNRDGVTKGTALPGYEDMLDSYFAEGMKQAFDDGGYEEQVVRQINTGIGVATEDLDELNYKKNADNLYNGGILDPSLATSEDSYYLKNTIVASVDDRNLVKKLLMEKGAASVSYHALTHNPAYTGYIDEEGKAHPVHRSDWENDFQTQTTESNHSVVLVGWDDNYDRMNFPNLAKNSEGEIIEIERPENNGAWLIKNSWGTGTYTDVDGTKVPYDGYFWISYEDTGFGDGGIRFFDVVPANTYYDNIYQYDGGWGDGSLSNDKEYSIGEKQIISARNVYTINRSENSGYEKISAVSFVTGNTNVDYTLKILVNDECKYTLSDTAIFAGSHTVDITEPILVKKGDTVDVQIEFSKITTGDEKLYVCTDTSTSEKYTSGITSTYVIPTDIPGRSYVKYDGENTWTDISELPEEHNECESFENYIKYGPAHIKLYTVDYVPGDTPSVKKKSSSVTSFRGIKDGNDFTFKNAVVIKKATLPGATSATIINNGIGTGWYKCTLSTDGFNGEGILYFQVPLDVIEIKGWTVNDVSLLGCPTTYLGTENQYAKYSAVISKDGSYTIGFEKDAANTSTVSTTVEEPKKVTETTKVDTTPVTTTKVDSSSTTQNKTETVKTTATEEKTTTESKQTATKSPFPILGILAGLGAAVVLVLRRK